MCMEKTAAYWERKYSHLPRYTERISIIKNITNYTFSKMGWTYETVRGAPKYTPSLGTINLDSYLEKNNGNVVNCYDNAFL